MENICKRLKAKALHAVFAYVNTCIYILVYISERVVVS